VQTAAQGELFHIGELERESYPATIERGLSSFMFETDDESRIPALHEPGSIAPTDFSAPFEQDIRLYLQSPLDASQGLASPLLLP
jgi:hypothetical protein